MPVYKELISDTSFESKFKSLVWLYYTYGFTGTEKLKDSTDEEDWNRLEKAFSGYMVWEKDKKKKRLTVLADAQELDHNCVQDLYKLCLPKNIVNLINICGYFAKKPTWNNNPVIRRLELYQENDEEYLSNAEAARLIGKIRKCETPEDAIHIIEGAKTNSSIKKVLKSKVDLGRDNEYTSDDLLAYINGRRKGTKKPADKNTVRNQLDPMVNAGFLYDRQETTGSKLHKYSFSDANLASLLECGNKVDNEFENHLTDTLAFFSRCFPFGEAGLFILDRYAMDYRNPFRVKDDYLMQAVNDYHILDLLSAIRKNQWVKLEYRHGTLHGIDTEIFVYPIKIKTGLSYGRQFLIIYNPFMRSVSSVRIEFIRSIQTMDDFYAKKLLNETIGLSITDIESDISNGIKLISSSWGISTSLFSPENAHNPPDLQHVHMSLRNDEQLLCGSSELAERLNKGCRCADVRVSDSGNIDFDADVIDAMEMVPYFRTFYGFLDSLKHPSLKRYELKEDLGRMLAILKSEELPEPTDYFNPNRPPEKMWRIQEEVRAKLENEYRKFFSTPNAHVKVFNEYFSIYSHIYADLISQLAQIKEKTVSAEEMNELTVMAIEKITERFHKEYDAEQNSSEITSLRLDHFSVNGVDFLIKKGLLKPLKTDKSLTDREQSFKINLQLPENTDLYKDLIPLTALECEWLKTIMEDPKIHMFLSEEETACIKKWLSEKREDTEMIPMDLIECFDRYKPSFSEWETVSSTMRNILKAIRENRVIVASCENRFNDKKMIPLNVVYTKRNDTVEVILKDTAGLASYCKVPIEEIRRVKLTDEEFNCSEEAEKYREYRKAHEKKIVVEFYERKNGNVVDRVLTEFSQFKKECVFDIKRDQYTLTVYYQDDQQEDVSLRLQAFGSFIRIVDHEHEIYQTILDRVEKQLEIVREKELAVSAETER